MERRLAQEASDEADAPPVQLAHHVRVGEARVHPYDHGEAPRLSMVNHRSEEVERGLGRRVGAGPESDRQQVSGVRECHERLEARTVIMAVVAGSILVPEDLHRGRVDVDHDVAPFRLGALDAVERLPAHGALERQCALVRGQRVLDPRERRLGGEVGVGAERRLASPIGDAQAKCRVVAERVGVALVRPALRQEQYPSPNELGDRVRRVERIAGVGQQRRTRVESGPPRRLPQREGTRVLGEDGVGLHDADGAVEIRPEEGYLGFTHGRRRCFVQS